MKYRHLDKLEKAPSYALKMITPAMLKPTLNTIPRKDQITWIEAECSEIGCGFKGVYPTTHPERPFNNHYCPRHNRSIQK